MKLSLFLLYFRIFSRNQRTKFLLYFGIISVTIFYVTCFVLFIYYCGTNDQNLRVSFASKHCSVDAVNLGIAQACFNILSDLYLLCIPIPIVLKLQLSGKKKISCLAIFMTGSLSVIFFLFLSNRLHEKLIVFSAVICSILNLYYRILNERTADFTWAVLPVYITSYVICHIKWN